MISLFNIPKYKIDTSNFNNLLHGSIVTDFEQSFASFVGAKYACSTNSATSAIFLCLNMLVDKNIKLPSILPPVVINAAYHAEHKISFVDNVEWIGNSYILYQNNSYKIIDSAQKVIKNQFTLEAHPQDIMIFSFYPTKPIGSCDGGMIVSDNKDFIDLVRIASTNGMNNNTNSWERKVNFPGYKYYMNSIQAWIANENLKKLPQKLEKLAIIREKYNKELYIHNISDHLYRIAVQDNQKFINLAKENNIECGIHYHACHLMDTYKYFQCHDNMYKSNYTNNTTVSIPFHENLTTNEINQIINFVRKHS